MTVPMQPGSGASDGASALKQVVIVGGGTSGWMSAAAIARLAPPDVSVTLVESDAIGRIGVGEATIPTLTEFNEFLGIPENEVLRAAHGTIKLGIEFVDWLRIGESYFHPFGFYGRDTPEFAFHQLWLRLRQLAASGAAPAEAAAEISEYNLCTLAARQGRFAHPTSGDEDSILSTMGYAYHLDAHLYARLLRSYAQSKGVLRIEGKVTSVEHDGEQDAIRSVTLEDGQVLSGDFFVDCSGFRGLLIEGAMEREFLDWSKYLPCDRAVAVSSPRLQPLPPYTQAAAERAGWRWRIPLQHRTGSGHVFCSAWMEWDEAQRILLDGFAGEPLDECRQLRFRTGHRREFWAGNCVAIGLAGGFIEPLESTGIHLTQMGVQRLVNLWPGRGFNQAEIAHYNRKMTEDYERVRDFIVLHYNATERDDSEFWRYVRGMDIPDSLAAKLDMFRFSGRLVPSPEDLFTVHSWLAVMLGQGIQPRTYDALVDKLPPETLVHNMALLKQAIGRTASSLPTHEDFIAQYCPAREPMAAA